MGRILAVLTFLLCSSAGHARNITLYRGLRVPPNRFKTTGGRGSAVRNSTKGRTWFSEKLSTAEAYTRGGSRYKTVIEVEVPLAHFEFGKAWKTIEDAHKWGQYDGTVSRKSIPDLKPYIKRIGLRTNGKTKWFTWADANKKGLFAPDADYARLAAD